jgi:glycosyltransferase involved in cell wall biosynthesis
LKIIVFVITYNNADILPWFLRHYGGFADEISAFDDRSTDGTHELLAAHPKVILRDWPHPGSGIDEDLFLAHWQEWYPKARGKFDWVMIVDPDEFIYSPLIGEILYGAQVAGDEVLRPDGYNMVGDGLPKDDGQSQIWKLSPMGVAAPVYSKPVVFQPDMKINWIRGKHALEHCDPVIVDGTGLKLLHYRYMGADYTRAKNAKNYARCGLVNGDKGAAWSCSPGYDGVDKEHSPSWAEEAKKHAVNVLEL